MTMHIPRRAGVLLLTCLLGACSSHVPPTSPSRVTVSAVQPARQQFTHDMAAFGSVIGNPRHARRLSLAHGGKVVAVMVSDGQSVQSGQPLFKIATAPATRKAYQQAQNALKLARDQLKRAQQLAAQHLATQAQVDAARGAMLNARSALAAQSKLGGSKAIKTVTAPVAGLVTRIKVTRGQRVPANVALASFVPAHGLVAKLGVQPGQAMHIQPGMGVTLHSVYGSIPDAQGKVVTVAGSVNSANPLVSVLVSLPAEWSTRLVVGAALSGSIHTASYRAWAVPRGALQSDARGDHVFQVKHGKAQRVGVKVLKPSGSPIAVSGALDPRAPVITQGSYEVANGDAVQVVHPASAPAKGPTSR